MQSSAAIEAATGNARPMSTHIKVAAAGLHETYGKAHIARMRDEHRKRLQFGYLVWLYVEQSPIAEPIQLKLNQPDKFSIPSLCAMSPVIKKAVRANGPDEVLDRITLPVGDMNAYRAILSWLDHAICTGRYRPIDDINDKPLVSYYAILEIAEKLKIEPTTRNIRSRYETMITYVPGQTWKVHIENVRYVYEELSAGHPLRTRLVESIAKAWVGDGLTKNRAKDVEDLAWEIEAFWQELEPKIAELEGKVQ